MALEFFVLNQPALRTGIALIFIIQRWLYLCFEVDGET